MADDSVQVRFGANTAPVEDGANTVKGAITSIGATVRGLVDLFLELGGAATGSFREIRTGAVEAGEAVKGTAEAVTAMGEAISGIGEALVAAFAVEQIGEFIRKMGEGAERIVHLGQAFGLTTNQVQQLQAEATLAGVPFETLSRNMSRLDVTMTSARTSSKQAAEVFKELGINIKAPVDQATLLSEALAGLRNIADPITRAADANKLFGRSWVELAPLIDITKEKAEEYNAAIDASGAVNASAIQHGEALAEANNQLNLAFTGLNNALMDALAPALTQLVNNLAGAVREFTASYNAGGLAKQAMDGLAVTVKALVGAVELLVYAFRTGWDIIVAASTGIAEALKATVDQAVGLFRQLWDLIEGLGRATQARLAGDFNGAQQAMSDAFERMQIDADKTTAQLVADAAIAGTAWLQVGADIAGALKDVGSLIGGDETDKGVLAGSQMRLAPAKPPAGGGGGHHGHTEDPNKKQVAEWEKTLKDADLRLLAYTGQWTADMSTVDAAYWQKKLEAAKGNTALQMDVLAEMKPFMAKDLNEQISAITRGVDEEIKQHERSKRDAKEKADEQVRDIKDSIEQELKLHKAMYEQIAALQKQFASVVNPVVTSFTHGLMEMAEGTKTFAQELRSIGQSIQNDFLKVIDKTITSWISGELTRLIMTRTVNVGIKTSNAEAATQSVAMNAWANIKRIGSDAAAAGGAAYKAMAGLFPAPLWGIAAGAAAFSGVMAFEGLASAAGGYDIPSGMNPLTQLHAQEMVLPARLANPMRDMLEGGSGAAGQEVHNHSHYSPTIHAYEQPNLGKLLERDKSDADAYFRRGRRDGRF